MALRIFTDSDGRAWEVWDVVPQAIAGEMADRRRADRRAEGQTPSAFDRRQAERRSALSPAMAGGWLAFRSSDERRRLAPIPDGWDTVPPAQLDAYRRDARVVGSAPMEFLARAPVPLQRR